VPENELKLMIEKSYELIKPKIKGKNIVDDKL